MCESNRKNQRRFISLMLCAVFCLQGCAVWRPFPFDRMKSSQARLSSLPLEYQTYYDYPEEEKKAELIFSQDKGSYVLKRFEVPLSFPQDLLPADLEGQKRNVEELSKTDQKTAGDLKLNFTNRIDVYYPAKMRAGEKRPLILISPILGGNMVVDHFARYYSGRGYIAAIVHRKRPYLSDKAQDLSGTERYLRTSVIRLRQALDWLEIQPEVDSERIGAFGISYGAILHSVLAAVEPRIRYHVLAMPAAPLSEVIMGCPDKGVSKLVRKAHEEFGWSHDKIEAELKEHIKTDPLYLAAYVPKDKIEFYVAAFDRVVGAGKSFRLWKAMGKPKLKVMPFGHYGGVMILPLLQTQSYWAFKRHFKQ